MIPCTSLLMHCHTLGLKMNDYVEINRESLLVWGYDENVLLDCYQYGESLDEALGNLFYEFDTFLKLFNDPKSIRRDEIHDLLYSAVQEAFLYYFDNNIGLLIRCLETPPQTEEFRNWQKYIEKLLRFSKKDKLTIDKEAEGLAKHLLVIQHSDASNIPNFQSKYTGREILSFKELECETYRIHELDNQVVGYHKEYLYIDFNSVKWLYSYGRPAEEPELIKQIQRVITRCSNDDKAFWQNILSRQS